MKKRIFAIFSMLCVLLSGCGTHQDPSPTLSPSDTTGSIEESPDALLNEYLSVFPILETPIREYGESTGYVQLEDNLVVRILYPEGELSSLNKAIEAWVHATVSYYKTQAADNSDKDDPAELTAEYASYLADNDRVSIKIAGLFDMPTLAHPIDILATFHASLSTGKLISLEDILKPGGKERLQSMVARDAGLDAQDIDEHLLDIWMLTSESLEITLERGRYLPMSEGTVALTYSYEELKNILSLPETPDPETTDPETSDPETPGSGTPDPETTHSPESEASPSQSTGESETPQAKEEDSPVPSIDPDKPMIALTFDDGPSKHTDRLLDAFASHGGKGTFFVVGNIIDNRPDTLKRMAAEGHEIAGHSWNHRQLTKLTAEDLTHQIMWTRAKIYDVTGIDPTLLRPPYGSYNSDVKKLCKKLGVAMVNWSLDTLDWKYKDADKIYKTILQEAKDGDIILCHDLHSTTVDAMERVIPALIEKGYQLVTVSELLSHSDKEVAGGNVYNKQ